MKRVLVAVLLLACQRSNASLIRLAWDASPTSNCVYWVYGQSGTNIARVDIGTNLSAVIEDATPGFYSFWATAERDGVESDPSNVVTVEVPLAPEGMRTIAIEYTVTLTNNWEEAGFFRLRIP